MERQPSLVTEWGYWLMLHPESTAYNLFDGNKYPMAELPTEISPEAKATMGRVDSRLEPETLVLGVESANLIKAYPLNTAQERACFSDNEGGAAVAVFWYGPTRSAVAFSTALKARTLSFMPTQARPRPHLSKTKKPEVAGPWLAGQ